MIYKSDTIHGYFPVSDHDLAIGFYLTGAGTERVGCHQPYPLPSHPKMYEFSWESGRVLPEYQFVYISSGRGEFESHQSGPVAIRAGMAMLLMPDVWHRYRPDVKTGWTEYWVSFNGALPHFWQKAGLISPANPLLHIVRRKALNRKLKRIIQAATERPGELAQMADCLADFAFAGSIGTHGTIGQYKSGDAVGGKVMDKVLDPGVIGVAIGGRAEFPARVGFDAVGSPIAHVEWGIG